MRAYVVTTGIAFALLVLAHAMRVGQEGTRLLFEPLFILTTMISSGLAIWAGWLVIRGRR